MTARQQRRTLEQTQEQVYVQPSKHCCFLMHAMYISQQCSCSLVKVIRVAIVLLFIQYNPQQWILPSADAVSSITYSNREFTPLTHCPGGFSSEEELKPHLQRPPQDPKAPGADGKPFEWGEMTPGEKLEELLGFAKHGFNQFTSDRISLHRDLGKDTRHPDCLAQKFHHCLPKTSVIIVFHNEAWSTLLRTVYSVLHTAPAALLTEIILVDDGSTDDHLQTPLDDYVKQLKIVRVLRQEWKGIVAARLLGAQSARGEVLTFLDAHCECFPGWLEPLLARIAEQPSAVVTPSITLIDEDDLEFIKPEPIVRMQWNFHWNLKLTVEEIPEEEMRKRKNEIYPIRTPTISGIFSVSKSYFESIGTYDDQMKFWGGENLEMSFRVWQCGGQLEIIPCSVVGHIFRKISIYGYPNSTEVINRNLVRLAEVWMDDYKWVVYRTNAVAGSIFMDKSFGNVTDRQQLRERLKCKSFSWYLENVYSEVYVPDILPLEMGQIENTGLYCNLDAEITNNLRNPVQTFECNDNYGATYFEYTSEREIRLSEDAIDWCLHANPGSVAVTLKCCQLKGKGTSVAPEQVWIFTKKNQLINFASGKCLTVMDTLVFLTTCNELDPKQQWNFI